MSLRPLTREQTETVFQRLLEHMREGLVSRDVEGEVLPALKAMFKGCVWYEPQGHTWRWEIIKEAWVNAPTEVSPRAGVVVVRILSRLPKRGRDLPDWQIAEWAGVGQRKGFQASNTFPGDTFKEAFLRLEHVSSAVIDAMVTSKLPFSADVALEVFRAGWGQPVPAIALNWLRAFSRFISADWGAYHELIEPVVEQINGNTFWSNKARFELMRYVHELRSSQLKISNTIDVDGWGETMLERLNQLPETERAALEQLLRKLNKTTNKAPTEGQTKAMRVLAEQYGLEQYKTLCFDGLERFLRSSSDPVKFKIGDRNKGILTAFVWSLLWFRDDPRVPGLLGDVAVAGLRKMSGAGIRAEKVGMAAVHALTQLEGMAGVTHLLRVRNKAPQQRQRTMLDGVLKQVTARLNLSEDDLFELATPGYGLQNGAVRFAVGDCRAEVRVHGREAKTNWFSHDGKTVKTVPAGVKRDHATTVKDIKRLEREIENQLKFHADRLDLTFMRSANPSNWTYPTWLERYAHHPLLGLLAGRLIWRFTTGNSVQDGVFLEDHVVDVHGNPISGLSDATGVRLWHPLFSSPDEVHAWRAFLTAREIRQPFWQAHRTVYLLTDAERTTRTYSNRFAAHILRNFQLQRLCEARGWTYNAFYSDDDPHIHLHQWNLTAEFRVQYANSSDHIATDQLRFYRGQMGERLSLEDVPPLAFSEIMRDVDFFVDVASVGNDPTWSDGGPDGGYRDYWYRYSFGDLTETAQTRKEILETLVPRLKIRDRVSLEGKFLHVHGDLRTYKIHLGSGNILMEPNDQYLCIVPDSSMEGRSEGVFLPFEGDRTLAIILSKAFLLAEDTRIKDETIIRQINT